MRILFVTGNYPTATQPAAGAFVQQLVWALARQGHECMVIRPVRYLARRFGPLPPLESWESSGGNQVHIWAPRYLSAGSKRVGLWHTGKFTQYFFEQAVRRVIAGLQWLPDVCYGHFLFPGGGCALRAARHFGIPAFVAVGEGTFWTIVPWGRNVAQQRLHSMRGYIAVSSLIKEMLQVQLNVPPEIIKVFPNGVDLTRFYPRIRQEMCRKHGFTTDTFNISFVGNYTNLKGVARVVEATRGLAGIRLILAGSGVVHVESSNIIFNRMVHHDQVPELLSASDLFVLPTAEEGSCNAVVEAMACGLPIVTSNGRYMDDLVDDKVAVRMDPYDVNLLRQVIINLMQDRTVRHTMAEQALARSREFDITLRAKRIADWIAHMADANNKRNALISERK